MEFLITVIVSWLSTNFDLPVAQIKPEIKHVAPQQMASMRYGAKWANQGRELVALYDDRTNTIFLSEDWTGSTPAEVSILVHEMAHHLQNVGKIKYECPGAREAVAYAAQAQWLGMFNKSLAGEFEIDPFTLKVATMCM